jgi:hypothetical protein
MTEDRDEAIERRIRERAFLLWIDEGQPEGRDKDHWELAKMAVAEEDGQPTTLKRPALPQPEPIEAVKNQAEFPTLTDQGEGQAPDEKNWR